MPAELGMRSGLNKWMGYRTMGRESEKYDGEEICL